jgi:predicted RND superfamily exporter protein
MKAKLVFVVAAIIMASCSTPKYSYKFDYHDYNAGRKDKEVKKEVASNPGPVDIQPEMLVAEAPVVEPASNPVTTEVPVTKKNNSAPLTLTKAEKKEMIKEFKQTVKKAIKMKKAGDIVQVDESTKAMDYNLKMALIFLVVSLASGLLYWVNPTLAGILGLIALIVAIVFFIKWLAEQ